jgi:dsRNA-specific ribonuclease
MSAYGSCNITDKELAEICPYSFRNCNPDNQLITEDHIHKIFKKFGINKKINDISHYRQAFVHESYVKPTEEQLSKELPVCIEEWVPDNVNLLSLKDESYDIMEFLGDRVLDLDTRQKKKAS